MALKKIMVVDDSTLLHRMYDLVLMRYRQQGCEIVHAYDGFEGHERLKENDDTELLLLDINMPRMGGIELLTRLGAEGWLSRGKVIMVSTEGREKDIDRALELGANGYVTKPFKPADLHAKIDAIFAETADRSAKTLTTA